MMLDFIKYPVIRTEKTNRLLENHQFSFDVDPRFTKMQIKKRIEEFFNVRVIAVNTHRPPRKYKRGGSRSRFKRAIVTVGAGDTLLQ